MSILDGYLRDQLNDALTAADIPQTATVTRDEVSGPAWDPTITPVDYAALGWVDEFTNMDRLNTAILVTDRRIFILASGMLITPAPLDHITINGATYSILTVQLDAAGCAFVCQCRT